MLVYAVDMHEPAKLQTARELILRLVAMPKALVLPWQSVLEFLATLHRWQTRGRLDREGVERYLHEALAIAPVAVPNREVIPLSLWLFNRYSLSHWDSLLLAACIDGGIDVLYSEDMQNGTTYESVTVVNPFA